MYFHVTYGNVFRYFPSVKYKNFFCCWKYLFCVSPDHLWFLSFMFDMVIWVNFYLYRWWYWCCWCSGLCCNSCCCICRISFKLHLHLGDNDPLFCIWTCFKCQCFNHFWLYRRCRFGFWSLLSSMGDSLASQI